MKRKYIILLAFSGLFAQMVFGQVSIQFADSSIVGEKWRDSESIIPVKINVKNPGVDSVTVNVSLSLDSPLTVGRGQLQLSSSEYKNLEIRNQKQSFTIKKHEELLKTFYIVLNKDISITTDKSIYIIAETDGVKNASTHVTIKRGNDIVYALNDYLHNPELKLNSVTDVQSNNNVLTIYGYKGNRPSKISVSLEKGKVYAVNEWSYVGNSSHWRPVPLSFTAIPFKVRPGLTVNNAITYNRTASAGLNNIGLNLALGKYQMDRYFSNGRKSTHKFSLGVWAAPSVEELDSVSTVGYLAKDLKSKQLFVSTGLTFSYSYNNISFVFVPIGWDFGTSTIGKNWVYNRQRWWGFGLAVEPKIFATLLNK